MDDETPWISEIHTTLFLLFGDFWGFCETPQDYPQDYLVVFIILVLHATAPY